MTQPIEAGKYYWIQVEATRSKVLAVAPSMSGLWWDCKTNLGIEITVPIAAFREKCKDDATLGKMAG